MPSRILLASAFALIVGSAVAADRPVVVELFTSEGCALGFHVDYWDRLGWRDPYSSATATRRQRDYAGLIESNGVYTPQMVVDGRTDVLGSDADAAKKAISDAARAAANATPLGLERAANGLAITVGQGQGRGRLWLVGYDRQHDTAVRRGENAGRTVAQANIVRSFEPVADWTGAPLTLSRPAPAGETAALILQGADGTIVGAAKLDR